MDIFRKNLILEKLIKIFLFGFWISLLSLFSNIESIKLRNGSISLLICTFMGLGYLKAFKKRPRKIMRVFLKIGMV